MRQFKNIVIVFILAGLFFSCNDWLDQKPYDKVSGDELYSTEAGVQEVLNGLYLGLLNRKLYGGELTVGLLEALSMHYSIPDDHKYESPVSFEYNTDYSKSYFSSIWKGMYKLIAECNVFLAQTEQHQANYNAEHYRLYQGEAIALRTFLHFDLLRMFGPAYTEENKNKRAIPYYDREVENPLPYMTVEEITVRLLADIDKAITLLAKDPVYENEGMFSQGATFWDFRNFRFNIYAAYALKARICLHAGDKSATYAITSALLQGKNPSGEGNNFMTVFPSVLSLSNNFRDPVFFSEVIFGMHDVNRTEVHRNYFSTELDITKVAAVSDTRNGELFPLTDLRGNCFSLAEELSENTTLQSISKYQVKSLEATDNMPYRYQIIPLIKKGEIFLMAAESSNNDTDKQHWLSELRLTRGYDQDNISGDLNNLLREEWEREFYAEGQFFYFLKRNGLTELVTQGVSGTGNSAEAQTKNVSLAYYVFPIPEEETNNRTE